MNEGTPQIVETYPDTCWLLAPAVGGRHAELVRGGRADVPDALHARLLLLPLPPHPPRRRRPLLPHLHQAEEQVGSQMTRQPFLQHDSSIVRQSFNPV